MLAVCRVSLLSCLSRFAVEPATRVVQPADSDAAAGPHKPYTTAYRSTSVPGALLISCGRVSRVCALRAFHGGGILSTLSLHREGCWIWQSHTLQYIRLDDIVSQALHNSVQGSTCNRRDNRWSDGQGGAARSQKAAWTNRFPALPYEQTTIDNEYTT